jgi:ABC-type branched-chain amino acid transport systems, ATPase component
MSMLKVNDLTADYGYISALREVNVIANEGEIVSIIGSNGAGKTTLLRCISGMVKATSGSIFFQDNPIDKRVDKIVKTGIVHVPEGRKTFAGMTIRDNLLVGGYLFKGGDLEKDLEEQYKLFPLLEERKDQFAGTLSGGEQQMLAISRGLMAKPKLILLDEPSLGLAPLIVNQVYELISRIRDSGITVLLVEQNAKKALSICDRAYVLENGKISITGTGDELLHSDTVKKAYLGG